MISGWISSHLLPRYLRVDKITPDGWDEKLNKPKKEAEHEIERRCNDMIKKLTKATEINAENLEYYSALKRYRLMYLLNTIIKNAYVGFKLGNINPKYPFELADPEAKKFADEQRKKMANSSDQIVSSEDTILKKFEGIITKNDWDLLKSKLKKEAELPPKVAVIGESGVGKTTTINNLFKALLAEFVHYFFGCS